MEKLEKKLRQFLIDEARSCYMDFGCVTPIFVFRMWGGTVSFDEIETAMKECLKKK